MFMLQKHKTRLKVVLSSSSTSKSHKIDMCEKETPKNLAVKEVQLCEWTTLLSQIF